MVVPPPTTGSVVVPPPTTGSVVVSQSVSSSSSLVPAPPEVGLVVTVSVVPPIPPLVVVGFPVGSSVAVSQSVSSSSSEAVEAPAARDELPANDVVRELLNPGLLETPATDELPGFNNELNQLPDEVGSALDAVVVGLALPAPASVVVGTTLVFEATGLDDSSSHSSSSSPGSELEEL